ncbi:hypothetical protein ACLMJK_001372 [Lecanora helva]
MSFAQEHSSEELLNLTEDQIYLSQWDHVDTFLGCEERLIKTRIQAIFNLPCRDVVKVFKWLKGEESRRGVDAEGLSRAVDPRRIGLWRQEERRFFSRIAAQVGIPAGLALHVVFNYLRKWKPESEVHLLAFMDVPGPNVNSFHEFIFMEGTVIQLARATDKISTAIQASKHNTLDNEYHQVLENQLVDKKTELQAYATEAYRNAPGALNGYEKLCLEGISLPGNIH